EHPHAAADGVVRQVGGQQQLEGAVDAQVPGDDGQRGPQVGVPVRLPHPGVDGGLPAAHVVPVDDVVVDEEGPVQQVHAGAEDGGRVQVLARDVAGGDVHQPGTQVLAAQGEGGHPVVGERQQRG